VGRLHPASNLDGAATDFQTSQVDQWMEFASNEVCCLIASGHLIIMICMEATLNELWIDD
jgi:hypothetical protein